MRGGQADRVLINTVAQRRKLPPIPCQSTLRGVLDERRARCRGRVPTQEKLLADRLTEALRAREYQRKYRRL